MKSLLLFGMLFCLSGSLSAQSAPDTLKSATLKVTGITCQGDMPVIKKKLINADGIDEVAFTEAKSGLSTFTVSYHSSVIGEQEIRALIESSPCCDNPNEFPYKARPADAKPKKKK